VILTNKLFYTKKISNLLKKRVWLKFEYQNLTGSHKDREAQKLIEHALKNNFKKIGCASTGNLAISLSFYAKIFGLKCYVWLNSRDNHTFNLIKYLGANIKIKKTSLKNLYKQSDKFFKKNKIFSANPGNLKRKLDANKEITNEILSENKSIDCIVTCINNGSHFLGMKSTFNKIDFIGVFSKSKLAKSINPYSKVEINKRNINENLKLIEAKDHDIIKGYELLIKEKIFAEGSACAVIGILKKIKKYKNICCVISGSAHLNLPEVQKIILKNNIKLF
jgi:cysteine synthase